VWNHGEECKQLMSEGKYSLLAKDQAWWNKSFVVLVLPKSTKPWRRGGLVDGVEND
jgi:hypothetical protein